MASKWERFIARIRRGTSVSAPSNLWQETQDDSPHESESQILGTLSPPGPAVRPLLVAASNSLGLHVQKELAKEKPHTNLVVSPVSVYLAMAMAALGTGDATFDEMAQALWINTIPKEEWLESFGDLVKALRFSAIEQELRLANSVWVTDAGTLQPDYEKKIKECFEAEVASLPFSDPRSTERVNRWVKVKTGGKIPTIVDSLGADERLMILNCVYFQGWWHEPFDLRQTRYKLFHAKSGDQRRPFMHMKSDFAYSENERFQVVRLDYVGASSLGLWVFLPSRDLELEEFVRGLDNKFWELESIRYEARPGTLALPRFKLECSNELIDSLRLAGVERCFNPETADFSGILSESEPLFISKVLQKTYLDVNERGTEAAAATLDMKLYGSIAEMEPPKPFEMVVDRPFFVALADTATGLLLFTASVWEV